MRFERDDQKYDSNYKKHGIRFEEAQTVFLYTRALEFYDSVYSDKEERFIRIGFSANFRLLVVVYCEQKSEVIRIISARKATLKEQRQYEETI